MPDPVPDPPHDHHESPEDARLLYELALNMATDQDQRIWQTPALALTAQAFLLSIALDPGTARLSKCLAAFLAALAAAMSMQLMAKHRFLGDLDRDEVRFLADRAGLVDLSRRHAGDLGARKAPGLLAYSSYKLWLRGLGLFGASSIAILVIALVAPDWLA